MLDSTSPVLPLAIYGIIVLLAGIVSLWLWPETNNRNFPETLEEAEIVASSPNPWVKWAFCGKNRAHSEPSASGNAAQETHLKD